MKLITDHTLPECLEGIHRHRRNEAFAIITQGLWLLKANALNARPPEARGQGRKSIATVALDLTPDSNPSFDAWLEGNLSGPECDMRISRRTAYNYMQAAIKLGLTHESGEEDIEALRSLNVMDGKKVSDLYALPKSPPSDSAPPAKAPAPAPSDYWIDIQAGLRDQFADGSDAVAALYQLPQPELDQLEQQLRHALTTVKDVKKERGVK